MSVEVFVPEMGESITEATVGNWLKKEGDVVNIDEPLVELETDKVTQEVLSPKSGVLAKVLKQSGDTVQVKEMLCVVEEGNVAEQPKQVSSENQEQSIVKNDTLSPAVAKLIYDNHLKVDQIQATGKNGLLSKEDVLSFLEAQKSKKETPVQKKPSLDEAPPIISKPKEDREKIVPMTRLRQAIANRLLQSQQNAAILTTFNEVDMSYVMNLRKTYKEKFKETHDANLGFMSFFTKAVIRALKQHPSVNAEIRGTDIVYKNYCDIGIAVGSEKGLVVPIIRDADQMSFAQIEKEILRLSLKVKEGKIELKELQGGTFTLSNGGVYGSMLSTPILNPPQTGILGMHNIVKRAVVIGDEVKIRPIMYLALSYDHRLIDGKEAVSFLVSVKNSIEDPIRLLLEV